MYTKILTLLATASLLSATSALAQTVVLVRHAEKADQSADPVLSEAGIARAQALREQWAAVRPAHIIVSPLQRTALTAAPVAAAHVMTPEAITLEGGTEAHVAAVVARIRTFPSDAILLVVGHSNTVPLIARALGYTEATDIPDCEYDRMTVVRLDGETITGSVGRYGAPSAC